MSASRISRSHETGLVQTTCCIGSSRQPVKMRRKIAKMPIRPSLIRLCGGRCLAALFAFVLRTVVLVLDEGRSWRGVVFEPADMVLFPGPGGTSMGTRASPEAPAGGQIVPGGWDHEHWRSVIGRSAVAVSQRAFPAHPMPGSARGSTTTLLSPGPWFSRAEPNKVLHPTAAAIRLSRFQGCRRGCRG
jgi:hypothetical protein